MEIHGTDQALKLKELRSDCQAQPQAPEEGAVFGSGFFRSHFSFKIYTGRSIGEHDESLEPEVQASFVIRP